MINDKAAARWIGGFTFINNMDAVMYRMVFSFLLLVWGATLCGQTMTTPANTIATLVAPKVTFKWKQTGVVLTTGFEVAYSTTSSQLPSSTTVPTGLGTLTTGVSATKGYIAYSGAYTASASTVYSLVLSPVLASNAIFYWKVRQKTGSTWTAWSTTAFTFKTAFATITGPTTSPKGGDTISIAWNAYGQVVNKILYYNGTTWSDSLLTIGSLPSPQSVIIPKSAALTGCAVGLFNTDVSAVVPIAQSSLFSVTISDVVIGIPGTSVAAGAGNTIAWNSYGRTVTKIQLSQDNKGSWSDLVTGISVTSNEHQAITLPEGVLRSACFLKLVNTDGDVTSVTSAQFEIKVSTATIGIPGALVDAGSLNTISWQSYDVQATSIQLSVNGSAGPYTEIASITGSTKANNTQSITLPEGVLRSNCYLKLFSASTELAISPQFAIKLTAASIGIPGASVDAGSSNTISWKSYDVQAKYIKLSEDNKVSWTTLVTIAGVSKYNASQSITLPKGLLRSECYLKLVDSSSADIATSDKFAITLTAPEISLVELINAGSARITWNTYGVAVQKLQLNANDSQGYLDVSTGGTVTGTSGVSTITFPKSGARRTGCTVKLVNDSGVTKATSATFAIEASAAVIIASIGTGDTTKIIYPGYNLLSWTNTDQVNVQNIKLYVNGAWTVVGMGTISVDLKTAAVGMFSFDFVGTADPQPLCKIGLFNAVGAQVAESNTFTIAAFAAGFSVPKIHTDPGASNFYVPVIIKNTGTGKIRAFSMTLKYNNAYLSVNRSMSGGTGTGTITTDSGTVKTLINGRGTKFATELGVGALITASGQTKTIVSVTNDSTLVVNSAFTSDLVGAAYTWTPTITVACGSMNVVGHTTDFTTLASGMNIIVGGMTRTIDQISGKTTLTVTSNFTSTKTNEVFTTFKVADVYNKDQSKNLGVGIDKAWTIQELTDETVSGDNNSFVSIEGLAYSTPYLGETELYLKVPFEVIAGNSQIGGDPSPLTLSDCSAANQSALGMPVRTTDGSVKILASIEGVITYFHETNDAAYVMSGAKLVNYNDDNDPLVSVFTMAQGTALKNSTTVDATAGYYKVPSVETGSVHIAHIYPQYSTTPKAFIDSAEVDVLDAMTVFDDKYNQTLTLRGKIAADVNEDGFVNSLDAIAITDITAGIWYSADNTLKPWIFVDAVQLAKGDTGAYGTLYRGTYVKNKVEYLSGLDTKKTGVNFMGVLRGDVNFSGKTLVGANALSKAHVNPVICSVPVDLQVRAGDTVSVPVIVQLNGNTLLTFSATFQVDPALFSSFVGIELPGFPTSKGWYTAKNYDAKTGQLRLSAAQFSYPHVPLENEGTVIVLKFVMSKSAARGAVGNISISSLKVSNQSNIELPTSSQLGKVEITRLGNVVVTDYALLQNYPNPFNPSTTIEFTLPMESCVDIQVYNVIGQYLTSLFSGIQTVGYHQVEFNASQMASGIYFYTIRANSLAGGKSFYAVKKMMLMK